MKEITLNEFMQKINAYRQSRIILTAWELDIFTAIEKSDGTQEDICKIIESNKRATIMLLDVLASMSILKKAENIYSNTAFSKKFLIKTSPNYLSGLGHSTNLWNLWMGLTDSVINGKPAIKKDINERDEQ